MEELPLALASESVVALGEKGETSVVALEEMAMALVAVLQVGVLEGDPKIAEEAFHQVEDRKEFLPKQPVMASVKIEQELLRFRQRRLHHWPNHRLHVQYPMHPLFEFQDGLD